MKFKRIFKFLKQSLLSLLLLSHLVYAQTISFSDELLTIEEAIQYLSLQNIKFRVSKEEGFIEILPDPNSQNKFVNRVVNKAHEMQHKVFFVTFFSERIRKGAEANVNFRTREINLKLKNLFKLDDPVVYGTIQHELRHVIETYRKSDASKLRLKIITPTIKDAVYGYGIKNAYRLDEALAFFQGGAITYALSDKKTKGDFGLGKDLTIRQLEILQQASFIKDNFSYNPETGLASLVISTPPETKKFMGFDVTSGKFILEIELEPHLSHEMSLKKSQNIFDNYYAKLIRVGNSYQKILNPNSLELSCSKMFSRLDN